MDGTDSILMSLATLCNISITAILNFELSHTLWDIKICLVEFLDPKNIRGIAVKILQLFVNLLIYKYFLFLSSHFEFQFFARIAYYQ